MAPYELWDGDELLLPDIRDRRTARRRLKVYNELGLYDPKKRFKDLRIVYRTPERYRSRGSPE